MLLDRPVGSQQGRSPICRAGRYMPSQVGEVVNRRRHSSEAFMVLSAGFPAVGKGIVLGPHFVRPETLHQFGFAVDHSDMRAKELIRGARQKIAIQSADVDRAMGSVMTCVNKGK